LAELYSVLTNSVAAGRSIQLKHFRAFEPRQIRLSLVKGEGRVRVESFGYLTLRQPLTSILSPSPKGEAAILSLSSQLWAWLKNFNE
jgi:hypothetical protein